MLIEAIRYVETLLYLLMQRSPLFAIGRLTGKIFNEKETYLGIGNVRDRLTLSTFC